MKPLRKLTTDDFADASEAYGDDLGDTAIFDLMDTDNDCTDAGGHLYVGGCGRVICVHCGKVAG